MQKEKSAKGQLEVSVRSLGGQHHDPSVGWPGADAGVTSRQTGQEAPPHPNGGLRAGAK